MCRKIRGYCFLWNWFFKVENFQGEHTLNSFKTVTIHYKSTCLYVPLAIFGSGNFQVSFQLILVVKIVLTYCEKKLL